MGGLHECSMPNFFVVRVPWLASQEQPLARCMLAWACSVLSRLWWHR